jgi:putative hydrolase of the HAD superfamily
MTPANTFFSVGNSKSVVLATNGHDKALILKLARTSIEGHFNVIYNSHSFGAAKEPAALWHALQATEPFDPARTLLVDDVVPVLDAARDYGVAHLVAVKRPDTRGALKDTAGYPALDGFSQLMPVE